MGTIHKQTAVMGDPRWTYPGVGLTEYSTEASAGVTKQVLIGASEAAGDFIVRYFTLPPGGHSALDQHAHEHGVVITHGSGRVRLGDAWHELSLGDAVHTAPHEVHQFEAAAHEPLGFICVIPRWAEADQCVLPEPA